MIQMTPQRGAGLVLKALQFAARKHRDQRRKGSKRYPYINHPIALAHVLWFEGGVRDGVTIAAALLHDTLEDTQTSAQELRGHLGKTVTEVVEEVTDTKFLKKESRKRVQIARARHSTRRARLVKQADKICNLRDMLADPPSGWPIERVRKYFDWAKRVVDETRGTSEPLERHFDRLYRQRP